MKIHVFRLTGRFAHWRRIYTNSSSLSYYYPTRTNIIGLIGSILCMEYDSYYEKLSKKNIDISVSIKTKLKKDMMIFNNRTKKNKEGITQVRYEILSEINNKQIVYNIYLKSNSSETEKLIQKMKENVLNNNFGYGVYLGQRQHKGYLEYIGNYEYKIIPKNNILNSICKKSDLSGSLDFNERQYNTDLIPLEFDKNRQLINKDEYIIELNKSEIKIDGHISDVYDIGNEYIKFF